MSERIGHMELSEFLLARIAEDEAFAERAVKSYQHVFGIPHYFDPDPSSEFATSMVGMSPRVALAECEAKRKIVAEHATIAAAYPGCTVETNPCCRCCSAGGEHPGEFPCATLRLLALPYIDHEDYREEWRP